MDQALITVTIPFDQNVEAVQQALAQLGNPADGKIAKKLDDTEVVHFMSLNVLQGEEGERSHLLLEASCDGSEESALEAIERALSQELGAILALAHIGGARIGDVLHEHSRTLGQSWWSTLGLPFAGTPGMSVRRIRKEHGLARRISAVLQEYPAHNSPSQLLERVRNRIWAQGDTKWAFSAEPAACVAGAPDSGLNPLFKKSFGDAIGNQPIDLLSGLRTAWQICLSHARTFVWPLLVPLVPPVAFIVGWYRSGFIAALGWLATALVLVWPAVTVFTVWLILRLRALEKRDDPVDYEPHKSTVEDQMKRETYFAQNLMFAVSTIKPGWVRRLALRFGLWSVTLVRYFCRPGFLGTNGIIHFARWMQVPGTDKLLFYSNYDGTWMGYVGDFVVNPSGAHGVTGIWSNCVGFPRTRGLSEEGAVDRDRLVRWARNQSRAVPFWYSGYPELTTERIRINAAIRQGLACAETNSDALDWLSCFGSMARAARTLEIAEIPTLAIGGLGKKKWHATCLVVHFNDDSNKCRSWLNKLQPHVTYGEVIEGKSALVLGLTGHALEQIGLAPEDLATFPVAFQQGMNTSYRARALGDLDKSAPSEWDWGGEKQPEVDAIVLIYGEKDFVARTKSDLREQIEDYGHSVQYDQEFAPHSTEPFGFADGISQPAIRGTRPARSKPNQNDIVEAGELVLGYPDNIGRFPPTPSVSADADPARLLSNAGEDPYRQRPEFSRMLCGSRRDLGRNGTFLVVRQLDQDVDAFDEWLDKASNEFAHRVAPTKSAEHVREMIAAKVIGRWKNGTPLVRHPDAPGPHPKEVSLAENDFNFGEEDPAGLRCPLGAHIRRANPRDSLTPGSSEQLAAVNRHRILRVGRRYDAQDGKHPGLLFMCINVDIERQFEFIQQRWLVNPSFHGLHGESDASLHSATFTVPSERGPVQLTGLHQFVTTRGGAYFFLPSRTALQFLAKLGSWGSYKIDPPTEATAASAP